MENNFFFLKKEKEKKKECPLKENISKNLDRTYFVDC